MILHQFILNICICGTLLGLTDEAYFQSDLLKELSLTPLEGKYYILDDHAEEIEITALEDKEGILYWYRRINTPVCQTGECKMVDVGLYWYATGNFLGLEVYGEHLTKTDHSIFSKVDYDKLISVLSNDWSSLREYEFSDLVDEGEDGVDGTSGATKKEIASEAVDDAVYTTFTLWHLANSGEKDQLIQLTADKLNEGTFIEAFLRGGPQYRYFILELFGLGKIAPSDQIVSLLLEGLKSENDPSFKNLAIKSLAKVDVNHRMVQAELTYIYPHASMDEKFHILTALKEVDFLDEDLYKVLGNDLGKENEWFSIKILNVLKQSPYQSVEVMTAVRDLLESENSLAKKTAIKFIDTK